MVNANSPEESAQARSAGEPVFDVAHVPSEWRESTYTREQFARDQAECPIELVEVRSCALPPESYALGMVLAAVMVVAMAAAIAWALVGCAA